MKRVNFHDVSVRQNKFIVVPFAVGADLDGDGFVFASVAFGAFKCGALPRFAVDEIDAELEKELKALAAKGESDV